MSSWVVSRAHIDIVVFALGQAEIATEGPNVVGQALWKRNKDAVWGYYGPRHSAASLGTSRAEAKGYRWRRPTIPWTREQLLNAVVSYRYQSVDDGLWEGSQVAAWVDAYIAGCKREGIQQAGNGDRVASGLNSWSPGEEHVHHPNVIFATVGF